MKRARIEVERATDARIPDGLQVGDEVVITALGVVSGIRDDLVDVTSFGSPRTQYTRGERILTLLFTDTDVKAHA